jgi:voltage-gated potassium channel
VIEQDVELEPLLREHGYPHVMGDATTEAALLRARVDQCRTVLALLASDADNLYLTITARELRPGIRIIARATDDASEARLRKAGADDVVSPIKIAGLRILQAALHH